MKTIKICTAVLLVLFSFSALALPGTGVLSSCTDDACSLSNQSTEAFRLTKNLNSVAANINQSNVSLCNSNQSPVKFCICVSKKAK